MTVLFVRRVAGVTATNETHIRLLVKNASPQRCDGLFGPQVVCGLGHVVDGHAKWTQWVTVDRATFT